MGNFSPSENPDSEKRTRPRLSINGGVFILTEDSEDYEPAEISDLSETGAYLKTFREISIGAKVRVYAFPENPEEKSIQLSLIVVRGDEAVGGYSYGCTLEDWAEYNPIG